MSPTTVIPMWAAILIIVVLALAALGLWIVCKYIEAWRDQRRLERETQRRYEADKSRIDDIFDEAKWTMYDLDRRMWKTIIDDES